MLSALFKPRQIIETSSSDWILDCFAWAIENFSFTVFTQESQLILPDNQFYPGNVSSVHQMAQSIFAHTKTYAGLQHWPMRLVAGQVQPNSALVRLTFDGEIRGEHAKLLSHSADLSPIEVSYNPNQVNQPQDLIAAFGQSFASILIAQQGVLPPGGKEFMPQAVDLLTCFMGFGVMLSNTAYQFKGGCGSCYNPHANRQAALPEQETLYCLALFSVLKSIPAKTVAVQLKSHLRSNFKHAYKGLLLQLKQTPHPALLAAVS